jgi:hypothetical protein
MGDLVRQDEFKAPSFVVNTGRDISIPIIIKLIKTSIETERPITKECIVSAYIEFTFSNREIVYRQIGKAGVGWSGQKNSFTKEEFKTAAPIYMKKMAIEWFKKNLGKAVLAGKLIVIPIIDI